MKTILFIDDDTLITRYYINALKLQNFEALHVTSTDKALDVVNNRSQELHLFILDIMMPAGKYAEENTNDGLLTGIHLYHDLRALRPEVPTIVLSNIRDWDSPAVKAAQVKFQPPPEIVLSKLKCPPFDLARHVLGLLSPPRRSETLPF